MVKSEQVAFSDCKKMPGVVAESLNSRSRDKETNLRMDMRWSISESRRSQA